MKGIEENIDLLYRYVDGDVTAEQALYVEQQIANNVEWQEIYDGLLFAEEKELNTSAILSRIEKKLENPKPTKATIIPIGLRKWISVAAAISGFLLLSYIALELINSGISNEAKNRTSYSSQPSVYPEDEIQIIPAQPRKTTRKQEFKEKDIEEFAAKRRPLVLQEEVSNTVQDRSESSPLNGVVSEPLATAQVHQGGDQFSRPNSYSTLLQRYGYREINPTLLNTTRGASVSQIPTNHYKTYSRNAMTDEQLQLFRKENERNYIARFPFNGIVKVNLLINEDGEVENYTVLESPSEEVSAVAKTLFLEKATWSIPLDLNGNAAQQNVIATVSFGNSIAIGMEFKQ